MKAYASAVCFLLFVAFRVGFAEQGCPAAEDVTPCVCTIINLNNILMCKNIEDAETLRNVFVKSARYRYQEVYIQYSSLQYLPHDMFENVRVDNIHLKNVTLSQLFDSPPKALDGIYKIHIEHTVVLRGILWELLKPLKSLKVLEIYFNTIKTLGRDFSKNVPKGLEQLYLVKTETKRIQSGVFADFPKLDYLSVDDCKLESLSRDILPVPFKGRTLNFNRNKLSEIPDDMFTQMPNLGTVGLSYNQIATIPESAFQGTGGNLEYIILNGNPIKCDCRILWLINNKPQGLYGKCESPKNLHGRELLNVTPGDLNC